MNKTQTVLVALDPSSDRGEEALEYARNHLVDAGQRIVLVVALTGPSANALRDFAVAESISMNDAADVYLEQVIDRLRAGGVEAEGFSIGGDDDEAAGLVEIARELDVVAVAVPAGNRIIESTELERLSVVTAVSVVVPKASIGV